MKNKTKKRIGFAAAGVVASLGTTALLKQSLVPPASPDPFVLSTKWTPSTQPVAVTNIADIIHVNEDGTPAYLNWWPKDTPPEKRELRISISDKLPEEIKNDPQFQAIGKDWKDITDNLRKPHAMGVKSLALLAGDIEKELGIKIVIGENLPNPNITLAGYFISHLGAKIAKSPAGQAVNRVASTLTEPESNPIDWLLLNPPADYNISANNIGGIASPPPYTTNRFAHVYEGNVFPRKGGIGNNTPNTTVYDSKKAALIQPPHGEMEKPFRGKEVGVILLNNSGISGPMNTRSLEKLLGSALGFKGNLTLSQPISVENAPPQPLLQLVGSHFNKEGQRTTTFTTSPVTNTPTAVITSTNLVSTNFPPTTLTNAMGSPAKPATVIAAKSPPKEDWTGKVESSPLVQKSR